MKLWDIAHSRSGDKGNISNISLIVYDKADYPLVERTMTAEVVKSWFSEVTEGEVLRYELPRLGALNFVLHKALAGGVTSAMTLDKHGKSYSSHLLDFEIDLGDEKK